MPKRKHSLSDDEHQPDPHYSKKKDSQPSVSRQEHAEPNSDESHRTEQLLHRESVTPPQRRPLRKRRPKQKPSSKRINKKAAPPPLTCCRTQTNSEEESDILHYNPDTALYYPGTDLVIDGWFQPCRYCCCILPLRAVKFELEPATVVARIRQDTDVVKVAGVVVLLLLGV